MFVWKELICLSHPNHSRTCRKVKTHTQKSEIRNSVYWRMLLISYLCMACSGLSHTRQGHLSRGAVMHSGWQLQKQQSLIKKFPTKLPTDSSIETFSQLKLLFPNDYHLLSRPKEKKIKKENENPYQHPGIHTYIITIFLHVRIIQWFSTL